MYLKRKVYDQLLDWKNDTVHSTLEVNGARQVGKTYIINKFADENFRHKIYINLFDLSGKQFMECYKKATDWTPGTKRPEQPLHDALNSSIRILKIPTIQSSLLMKFRNPQRYSTVSENLPAIFKRISL